MQRGRRGERLGWTLGWLGAFLWVVVLAVVFLVRGQMVAGLSGLALALIAETLVVLGAPWRLPHTRYSLLMAPLLVLVVASGLWAFLAFGAWSAQGVRWWDGVWFLPMFIPLFTLSGRTWHDGEGDE